MICFVRAAARESSYGKRPSCLSEHVADVQLYFAQTDSVDLVAGLKNLFEQCQHVCYFHANIWSWKQRHL